MTYQEFKKRIQDRPIFWAKDISLLGENEQLLRNQIRRWQARGLLIKLKKGLYLLNETDRRITPSRLFLANQLYSPSYVSLEYALNFYGLIPERVYDVTSATTRKTKAFRNGFGTFGYRHLKKGCFNGFAFVKDDVGLSVLVAEPEKAVVDFLYFNLGRFKKDVIAMLREGYRFQNVSALSQRKIVALARLFNNKKLLAVCQHFCEFAKEERR